MSPFLPRTMATLPFFVMVHPWRLFQIQLHWPQWSHNEVGRRCRSLICNLTVWNHGDRLHAPELVRILSEAGQEVPPALAKYTSKSVKFFDSDDEEWVELESVKIKPTMSTFFTVSNNNNLMDWLVDVLYQLAVKLSKVIVEWYGWYVNFGVI